MKDSPGAPKPSGKISISEELASRRRVLKITIEELSQKTSIPTKYLRRVEKGRWENLPSAVYTKGFLRKYAKEVGYNPDEAAKRYDKEIAKEKSSPKSSPKEKRRISIESFSAKTARRSVVLIVLVLVLGYIGYQLSAVLANPNLTVESPATEELLTQEDSVEIIGEVDRAADLYLNNQPLAVEGDGSFRRNVELLPGLNILEIKAVSRFGKETVIEKKIFYNP